MGVTSRVTKSRVAPPIHKTASELYSNFWKNELNNLFITFHCWRRVEARRQYGIGFNFVPWGDVIEKGATNIYYFKEKLCNMFEKNSLYDWINCINWFKKQLDAKYVHLLPLLQNFRHI